MAEKEIWVRWNLGNVGYNFIRTRSKDPVREARKIFRKQYGDQLIEKAEFTEMPPDFDPNLNPHHLE